MRKLTLRHCTRCGDAVPPYASALAHDAPYDPYSADELMVSVTEESLPPRYHCQTCDERWPAHMAGFELTGILCLECQEVMDIRADYCGLCGRSLRQKAALANGSVVRDMTSHTAWRKVEWVIHEVSKGTVYCVDRGSHNAFVLLPAKMGQHICGLIDEEYGWPAEVNINAIRFIRDISPTYRRHPFIVQTHSKNLPKLLAVAVTADEYERLLVKLKLY